MNDKDGETHTRTHIYIYDDYAGNSDVMIILYIMDKYDNYEDIDNENYDNDKMIRMRIIIHKTMKVLLN